MTDVMSSFPIEKSLFVVMLLVNVSLSSKGLDALGSYRGGEWVGEEVEMNKTERQDGGGGGYLLIWTR